MKKRTIFLLILLVFFACSPNLINNTSFSTSEFEHNNIKASTISGKIQINGDSGWAAFKAAGNCTGDGTFSDPYVIEDLIIDGEGSGSCISIENSSVYFRIENCTLYNSGGYPNAGILLSNVNNSQSINNNCSSNYNGIHSENCYNSTMLGNIANNNSYFGINLVGSENNTILGNTANNNYYQGIQLEQCKNNNITGNTANNNHNGIRLLWSNHNTILRNIADNNAKYSYSNGINLYGSDNNTISGNNASNNAGAFINLQDSDYNIISGNIANNNSYGIYMNDGCNDNTILNNTVNDNTLYGIYLYHCDYSTIKKNRINRNDVGIMLDWSNYNNIIENTFINNGVCILEDSCIGNIIENNDCIDSTNYAPILIDGTATGMGAHNWTWAVSQSWCYGSGTCSEPYIIENLTIDGYGIASCIDIRNSDSYFIIKNCTVYNSGEYNSGIWLYNDTKGILDENNCTSNYYGVFLVECNNITISGNFISDNGNSINLQYSTDITVSGNIMDKGLNLAGLNIEEFDSFKIDATNLVNGNPLYYYTNEVNLGSSDFINAGQVILVNCNDSLISNLNVSYISKGISLYFCQNNEVSDNIANNNIMNGIFLHKSNYNIILKNTVSNGIGEQNIGIYLSSSNKNAISDNILTNNTYGIELSSSNNNTISDNIVTNNSYGIILQYSHSNLVSGNNASNNYQSGIYLTYCNNDIITKNDANYNWNGIRLREGSFNIVFENNANDNTNGIVIQESTNNEISNNLANNNVHGFFVVIYSDHNKILENKVENNEKGIYLGLSSENTISRNTVNTNDYGIEFEMFCNNNNITENIINYNSFTGIVIDTYSTGNYIYLNCFNNNLNAVDDGSENHWDNGIKGNFWGDYNGTDLNNDGIGDTPYNITGSAGSQDNFPLMKCPLPQEKPKGGLPMDLIIIISVISGGSVAGIATILLIRRKRKRIE